jgi:hypothetical protein
MIVLTANVLSFGATDDSNNIDNAQVPNARPPTDVVRPTTPDCHRLRRSNVVERRACDESPT